MEHPENDPKYNGLKVNKGILQPPSVNPYLKRRARQTVRPVEEYVKGILSGDRVLLSQAVTLVESSLPEHQETAQAII
ncbi:MAG TPA: methylmalonyl Co-A mutase-associated GTPase MeaB, partial [Proteiniphilum sp.]|nr:methylmalonyl Co-A mutase-associated GTPase MeaB [Proteiniphilum sp.]